MRNSLYAAKTSTTARSNMYVPVVRGFLCSTHIYRLPGITHRNRLRTIVRKGAKDEVHPVRGKLTKLERETQNYKLRAHDRLTPLPFLQASCEQHFPSSVYRNEGSCREAAEAQSTREILRGERILGRLRALIIRLFHASNQPSLSSPRK